MLTIEPATYTEEGMYHAEQVVLVIATGGEILSTTAQDIAALP